MTTIVMTGATGGIGKVALTQMAAMVPDLSLVLVARKAANLSWAQEEMGEGVNIHVIEADLNNMTSTAAAAERITQMVADGVVPEVSALVLNAGVQHTDARTVSVDGLEDAFAVNVLANHVLVRQLAPLVRPGGRVVITVSDTHFGDLRHNLGMVPGPVWREPVMLAQPGTTPDAHSVRAGRTAYSTSKLAAIYQVHEYARRYPERVVIGYNPGFVPATGLARSAGPLSRFAMARLLPLLTRTPIASSVETAGAELATLGVGRGSFDTGAYVNHERAEPSSPESYDPARERALVDHLDALTASI